MAKKKEKTKKAAAIRKLKGGGVIPVLKGEVQPATLADKVADAAIRSQQLAQQVDAARAQLNALGEQLVKANGAQEALWGVFLDGEKMTAQEAVDSNYKGVGDALKRLQSA